MTTFFSREPENTRRFAEIFRKKFLKNRRRKKALVVALQGNLGAGKTTFIQALAKNLGLKRRITSPSFLIIKSYSLKKNVFKKFFHLDAYRLKKISELTGLDFIKIISRPENLVLIEWAENVKKILPPDALWLKFKLGKKENERVITVL